MRDFLRQHLLLVSAFLLVMALTLFFGVRLVVSSIVWSSPERLDQPIAAWMTPRYVVRSWNVPPEVVADALALAFDGSGRRVTLEELADGQGIGTEELIGALEEAISAYRAAHDE